MEILVLTSNPKSTGALATLTDLVAQSARAAGASVEEIRLEDRQIGYCRFCMTCFRDRESPVGPCVQADDMPGLLERLRQADGYIFATPVSSGHANARFKTFAEPDEVQLSITLPAASFTVILAPANSLP